MKNDAIVLDTNIVIELLKNDKMYALIAEKFPFNPFCISVVTQIESLSFPEITPEIEQDILNFLKDITVMGMEVEVVAATVSLRRLKPKLKLPDAVVAATAIVLDVPLITRDTQLLNLNVAELTAMYI